MRIWLYLFTITFALLLFFGCKEDGESGGQSTEKPRSISDSAFLVPVRNGKLYQYITQQGDIAINPQFSEATVFREGTALVESSGDNALWGYTLYPKD